MGFFGKLVLAALVGFYVGVAYWANTGGGAEASALLASGPLAVGAFAFGYAVDLLIFGLVVGLVVRRRRRSRSAEAKT